VDGYLSWRGIDDAGGGVLIRALDAGGGCGEGESLILWLEPEICFSLLG